MVVKTNWPGATAREVEQQVTDRVERKLQEVPNVDWVRSYSKPGESLVFFALKRLRAGDGGRRSVRTRCARRSATSATRCRGHPGTVLQRRVRRHLHQHLRADRRRLRLSRAQGIRRQGARGAAARAGRGEGRLHRRAGREGLHRAFQQQARNARRRARADHRDARARRTRSRPPARSTPRPTASTCGRPARSTSVDAIRDLSIRANNRMFRLGDIANVTPRLRRSAAAEDALAGPARRSGIGITMVKGGDVIELGNDLDARASARIAQALPVGVEISAGRRACRRRCSARSTSSCARCRGGADRARRVAREPGPAHRPRRRGVDPAGARRRRSCSCGCSASACTRSRSAR